MNFPILRDNLKRVEAKKSITVKDILGLVVRDVFDDLDEAGLSLSELPLGVDNEEYIEAISLLCSLARMVGKIYKKNQQVINASSVVNLWAKSQEKLNEAVQVLEEVQKEIEKNIVLLEDYTRKKELIEKSLQENNNLLEKLYEVQCSVKAAEEERERIEQEILLLQSQLKNLTKKIEQNEMKRAFLKQKIKEGMVTLECAMKETENTEQELQSISNREQDLLENRDEKSKKLVAQQNRIAAIEQQLLEMDEEIAKQKEQIEDKEIGLHAKASELNGWKEKFEFQCKKQAELDDKLNELIEGNKYRYHELCVKQEKARNLFDSIRKDNVLNSEWIYDQETITIFQEKSEFLLKSVELELAKYYQSHQRLLCYLETGNRD